MSGRVVLKSGTAPTSSIPEPFDLATYYHLLEGITIPTACVEIPPAVVTALQQLYPHFVTVYYRCLRSAHCSSGSDAAAGSVNSQSYTPFQDPTLNWLAAACMSEHPALTTLLEWAKELNTVIDAPALRTSGCFARLSTRSPKDSLALRRRVDAGLVPMRCTTGLEVLELLATSERIYQDVSSATTVSGSCDAGAPILALRQWAPLSTEHEFRVFVHDSCVRAISQYSTHSLLAFLQPDGARAAIAAAIVRVVQETVLPALAPAAHTNSAKGTVQPYANCIVDVHVDVPSPPADASSGSVVHSTDPLSHSTHMHSTDGGIGTPLLFSAASSTTSAEVPTVVSSFLTPAVTVIELNPFSRRTGAALFSWLEDSPVLSESTAITLRYNAHSARTTCGYEARDEVVVACV